MSNPRFFWISIFLATFLAAGCSRIRHNDATGERAVKEAYMRGVQNLEQGKWDAAVGDFNTVIEKNPELAEAYVCRGLSYKEKGDLEPALTDLNRAIELKTSDPVAWLHRGRVYLARGDADRAIADMDQALARNPHMAAAYHYRVLAHLKKGDAEHARADLENLRRLDPTPSPELVKAVEKASSL